MKLSLKRFFITFVLCTFGGTFTLRCLALDFLYRTMDSFVSGISATIISSLALSVGFSFVLLAYFAGTTPQPAHFIFAACYTLWLTLIKPRSSESWNLFQALISIFVGTSAATILCAELNPLCLVLLEFFIAYASARHVLVQRNDSLHDGFPAFIFAIFSSELALLAHSWLIVYSFPTLGLIIPQLTLILSVFAFLCAQLYFSIESHDGRLKFSEAVWPTLFSLAIIALIIFSYSQPKFNV